MLSTDYADFHGLFWEGKMNADRCTVWDHLRIGEGMTADYAAMKAFHYRSGRPGGVKRVFVAQYCGPGLGLESAMPRAVADGGLLGSANSGGMVAGVIVEALPSLGCALRSVALPGRFCCG